MIHILDGQNDLILDYITLNNIIDDNHRKSLENTLETYDFIALNKTYAEHLEKRNRIIIPDEDESLREFIISEVIKYKDSEGYKVQVFANASYLELKKANIIYPSEFKGSASQHGGRALNDTGWQMGLVEVAGNISINIESHTNPYEYLKRIAKEFGGELRFRIEHDGSKIKARYVDILERIGEWNGREVEFGKDLDGVRRVEKQDIVTALLGLGPEDENGQRLEVLVEDEDALQRWGRIDEHGELKHLIEPYEIQSERTEMTETEARQYTRTALDKRINTQVTYEASVVDLQDVLGHENKKIWYGDTIRIKDTHFHPPLYLEARVFEMTRSIKRKAKKDIKLGDYIEYTEEEVNTIWDQLKKEIQDRLARLVIATVVSSGGDIFKNGQGETELIAKTFVNGHEVDEDATRYDYQWIKFDKDGKQVNGFIETGKQINVTANEVDEKATYRVLIAYGLDVVTTAEYTLTSLFDGQKGADGKDGVDGRTPIKGTDYFDGVDGQDGKSEYLWVRYSQNKNGNPMTPDPTNAKYIGIATTETATAPSDYAAYNWSLVKGNDGVAGETGSDGRTSYLHIKYSNDGGNTFTSNNGEAVGEWIGTYVDFTEADSNDVNKYTWNKVKGDKGDAGERGVQGLQGSKGDKGIAGAKGADGRTSYTHIAYADTASGGGFSQSPTNKKYIGMYVDFVEQDSSTPSKYNWSLIKGADGTQGIAGPKGSDGKTPYFHTAWANNATGTSGFSTTVSANKLYIGTYTDFTQADSNTPSKYNWTKIKGDKGDKGDRGAQGIKGDKGANGQSQYVHIRYSPNSNGSSMTTTPNSNTQYVGLANTNSATAPGGYASYTWAKFKGEQGNQGIPGAKGSDGQTTYTWVKYADTDSGGGMSDSPKDKKYIGLAFNKTTPTESNVSSQYTWSLMPQNIEVGGRNLLIKSRDIEEKNWGSGQGTASSHKTADGGYIEFTANQVNANVYYWLVITGHLKLSDIELNKEYTISADLKGESGSQFGLRSQASGGDQSFYKTHNNINTSSWTRVYTTFRFTNSGVSDLLMLARLPSTNTKLRVRRIQLERGNAGSDWIPAPEDVQAEIDKAKQEAKDAQTTADGKNSVFKQNNQPSTSGRKVGDVWFKTNDDNKMFTFNGTSWVAATFGESAITAKSITALHIKSLNGLNVNDQFIVDTNGNVSFKGNLTGATGTFSGRLAAKEGYFGDNINLRNGKLEIVRPDGAISMSDGMVDTGYTVTGNDPQFMGSGRSSYGATFPAFAPGGDDEAPGHSTSVHIYGRIKGKLDGRENNAGVTYTDTRDSMGAIAVQKYHFIHSARFLVFAFRKYAGSKFSVHVMNNASANLDDRLFFKLYEKDTAGLDYLVVDLGKPLYNKRTVTFKIGWTNGWGPGSELIRFIMENVYLTDFE